MRPQDDRRIGMVYCLSKWVICFVILAASCPVYGQGTKKMPVTEKDYHLWGTLYNDKISEYGKWVSFTMRYDEHPDTLYLKKADGRKLLKFPNATSGTFAAERYFATLSTDGMLSVASLDNGSITNYRNISSYLFAAGGQYLVQYP